MIRRAGPFIGDDDRAAVDRVLCSGPLSQGPEVAAFEPGFAELVAGRHCRVPRSQGMEQRDRNEVVGLNVRMTDLAAALGRVQLGRLPALTDDRRAHAGHDDEHLAGVDHLTPPVHPHLTPDDLDVVVAALLDGGES